MNDLSSQKKELPPLEIIYSHVFKDNMKKYEKKKKLIEEYLDLKYTKEILLIEQENLRTFYQGSLTIVNSMRGFLISFLVFVLLLMAFYMDKFGFTENQAGFLGLVMIIIIGIVLLFVTIQEISNSEKIKIKLEIIKWVLSVKFFK